MPCPNQDTNPANLLFDPLSKQFARDPYPAYAQLRNSEQPFFYQGIDGWLLSRYDDVQMAALNTNLVRSMDVFMSPDEVAAQRLQTNWHDMPNHARFVQTSLLDSDGEPHTRLRMLVLGMFTGRYVERHRSMIQSYVDGLLDVLLEQKEIDFVSDLAAHVPGHIIGNVLGVPHEDCPQLATWSENVVQFFDIDRTDAHKRLAEQATTEFYHYLQNLILERSKQPKNDLITMLIEAKKADKISETELISLCMLILMAGHGSTIDVIGSGMITLLKNPNELNRLRKDPGLIHTAVQEMFRYESPLPFFHRYAAEDVEVQGKRYPKGTKFGLLYGSANRDSDYFPSADTFDIARSPNRHIAFGRGSHLCLGNHLSRLDMEVIFLAVLQRVKSIEPLLEEPEFKRSLSIRGPISLPLLLTPA